MKTVSWCGLTLLSIVQFVLGSAFLPGTSVEGAVSAGGPLFAMLLATSLYFLSGFMAGLSGGRLSKAYTTVFLAACLPIAGMLVAGSGETAAKATVWRQAASFMLFLFKTLAIGGWCTFAWVRIGKMTDPLERQGRRGIVLSYLGGYVVFEGALRNVGSVVGLPSADYAIAFLLLATVAFADTQSSPVMGFEVEWRHPMGFAAGGEFFYFKNEWTDDPAFPPIGAIETAVYTVNGKYYFDVAHVMYAYVGLGLGYAVSVFNGAVTGDASGFAYQAMAGVEFRFKYVGLNLQYKHLTAEVESELPDGTTETNKLGGSGGLFGLTIHITIR